MGGSRPATSTTKTKTTNPKQFLSVVPELSYRQAGKYYNALRADTQAAINDRYREVGTPSQLGAQMAGYKAQEAANYLATMPRDDKYIQATTGSTGDRYSAARDFASSRLSDAQTAYGQALQHVNDAPEPISNRTPHWASETIKEGYPPPPPSTTPTNTNNTASGTDSLTSERDKPLIASWLRQGQVMPAIYAPGKGPQA